ncbi:hypothetical protein C2S52_021107 [Perilla frutescens var. hirtella]|nr:hypothetical protein C2S52_021107 [Perilla frutescens var. hirtella]
MENKEKLTAATGDEAVPSSRWLPECLYRTSKKLFSIPRVFSKLVLSTPPQGLPVVTPPPSPAATDPHPVVLTIQYLELGKLVLTLPITATLGLLFSPKFDRDHHIIIVGSMAAFMFLWNGILIRTSFPRLGYVLELLGIGLVLLFLNGLVATFLSGGLSMACWILGAMCMTPFVCVLFRSQPAAAA